MVRFTSKPLSSSEFVTFPSDYSYKAKLLTWAQIKVSAKISSFLLYECEWFLILQQSLSNVQWKCPPNYHLEVPINITDDSPLHV
jgi:hypothetical protein